MKPPKNWKRFIKRWVDDKCDPNMPWGQVAPEALAPLLLRQFHCCETALVVTVPVLSQAEELTVELRRWNALIDSGLRVLHLPEATSGKAYLPETESARASALYDATCDNFDILVTTVAALMTPVPEKQLIQSRHFTLSVGATWGMDQLLAQLVDLDYDDELEVTIAGEFSRRGGIVDIFSPAHQQPVRIEFWGDEIESMRLFAADSQRSVEPVDHYQVVPRGSVLAAGTVNLLDYFSADQVGHVVVFPDECRLHLERFGQDELLTAWEGLLTHEERAVRYFLDEGASDQESEVMPCGCYPSIAHIHKTIPTGAEMGYENLLGQLIVQQVNQWVSSGYKTYLVAKHASGIGQIQEWCEQHGIQSDQLAMVVGDIERGLFFPSVETAILCEKELFSGLSVQFRPAILSSESGSGTQGHELLNLADLDEGDHVVHLVHGIGIFRGIRELETQDSHREVMVLEYAGDAVVYVPLWQAHLVSRYIGGRGRLSLGRIGGKAWARAKEAASRSVRQMALDMLKIQAMREDRTGYAFPADDLSQRTFDESFEFEDTTDQRQAAIEIKLDMSKDQPMDRLLCGDVGYGKTEVAMRAAFKAVMNGKQVAVLVPTTILAQQHFYSFRDRFAEYPVIVEMLSRFRSGREQSSIISDLTEGKIDIVIGTHRLVQNDVEFSDLGLVIIDEEQRFGVQHKERFKQLRATVDVLTMTATPIPRTLYLAMSGIRDLSTIATAPGHRLPIKTIVSQHDEAVITAAIEREVERGGQVFYLHNRVRSIEDTCTLLRRLVPEASFAIGHGQMDEEELEDVMAEFLSGNIDVLVCTTIIESGLDIPNANTIIIDRADRFGLAELYQLRGRVGRWKRQAFAYLLLPRDQVLTGDARKRISAIRRYTQLGAGFQLALRDLEIRGAGNLLGKEQSGHINAVGFDLYCQLLRKTVAELRGEAIKVLPETEMHLDFVDFGHRAAPGKLAACLPPEFIPTERYRINAYRRLSSCKELHEIDDLAEEFRDRYGPVPVMADCFLRLSRIRLAAAHNDFDNVSTRDGKLLLERNGRVHRDGGQIPRLPRGPDLEARLQWLEQYVLALTNS